MVKRPRLADRLGADAHFTGQPAAAAAARSTANPKNVKVTFYITPEQNLKLERVRMRRLEDGERVDKSDLVREAIDLLQG